MPVLTHEELEALSEAVAIAEIMLDEYLSGHADCDTQLCILAWLYQDRLGYVNRAREILERLENAE